jgi:N-acetylglutamate synthase-like GNAT family acetyltransferase
MKTANRSSRLRIRYASGTRIVSGPGQGPKACQKCIYKVSQLSFLIEQHEIRHTRPDVPVGFAHLELIDRDGVHLEEIDVHPEHGRRGLGTKLVLQVCQRAASIGYGSVTLTTFRDVPWNMPFYARLGFGVVPPDQLSLALRAVVEHETRRGLDPSRRVVMARPSA